MSWDTHVHSSFSGDCSYEPEIMAQAGVRKNLKGICFTDHMDYDYPKEPDTFLLDLDSYASHYENRLRPQFEGKITLLHGIELGLQPHLAGKHRELLSRYQFDFVIGSTHVVHHMDPYYREYFEGKSEENAYREYFESVLKNIQAFDGFDVCGHLDYIVRYGPDKNKYYRYETYRDVIDEILKFLIAHGKGIEINTAGYAKGLGQPHPAIDIIKRYRGLGGEIITIGSDAHAPENLAASFQKIPEILSACGFSYFTVFKKRKPEFIPVSEW